MEIYLSPELIKPECQILNIVNQKQKALGYVTFLFDEKKMYVYGQCEEEGVCEDFKDILKPFIQGMSKAKPNLDVYVYVSVGGKNLNLNEKENDQE